MTATFRGEPPAAATLVSPTGAITDDTPTYTWNAVSDSTWYYNVQAGTNNEKSPTANFTSTLF